MHQHISEVLAAEKLRDMFAAADHYRLSRTDEVSNARADSPRNAGKTGGLSRSFRRERLLAVFRLSKISR